MFCLKEPLFDSEGLIRYKVPLINVSACIRAEYMKDIDKRHLGTKLLCKVTLLATCSDNAFILKPATFTDNHFLLANMFAK